MRGRYPLRPVITTACTTHFCKITKIRRIGRTLSTAAAVTRLYSLIILGPVLIPLVQSLGVDLVHFGVVVVVNLCIGTITPPVGICLYVVSAVSGERIDRISGAAVPVIAIMTAVLGLITYVPWLILLVPRTFGY